MNGGHSELWGQLRSQHRSHGGLREGQLVKEAVGKARPSPSQTCTHARSQGWRAHRQLHQVVPVLQLYRGEDASNHSGEKTFNSRSILELELTVSLR